MRLWFIAAALIILLWAAGLLLRTWGIPIPILALVWVTLGIIAICVAIVLYRRWRAKAAARALERELLAQADSGPTTPDRQAEIIELRIQLEKGVRALKQSRLGSEGRDSLYTLPWYVIVGPPGAGKTTALKHSGLNFPFLDPRDGGGIKGVGGTRNCDWWFTNEAVLLDTAGRYATEEDDRTEWFAFLDLLRRYRKQKPINGVLLAVNVVDLLEGTNEQVLQLARTLRARIDELMMRLDMVVPVYLTFTKTDLVAGFVEFFDSLKKSERDQVFGATFPLDAQAGAAARFDAEFDEMVEILQARAVRAIGNERDEARRGRIFQFPMEFRALQNPISEFLATLFEETAAEDNPIFRGFYFTSGTQEGNPVDRVLGGIARAFGLAPAAGTAERVDPKSYFVTDLFRRVVFPDQDVAARTRRERRRRLLGRLAFAAAALTLGLFTLSAPSCSFRNNMALVSAARSSSAAAAKVKWQGDERIPQKSKELDTLRFQLQQLDKWREESPPLRLRWGMYVGDTLYPGLRDVYTHAIERGLKRPAIRQMETKLRSLTAGGLASRDRYNAAYDLLKLYLMMSWPEKLDPEWASPKLTKVWVEALQSDNASRDELALGPHVEHYVTLMKRGEVKPWSRDASIVSRARSELLRTPQLDRMYEALVRDANAEIKPIKHSDIFYGAVAPYVEYEKDVEVEGAYTKPGWELVKELLSSQSDRLSGEAWVLGEDSSQSKEEVERQIEKLRTLYFERFKKAWRDFFIDILIHEPKNAESALEELTALSEPVWAYRRLIDTLHENVTLDVSDGKAMGIAKTVLQRGIQKAKQKLNLAKGDTKSEEKPISPVEAAFKPITDFGVPPKGKEGDKPAEVGLDQYQATLAKLVAVLTDLRDGETDPDPGKVATEFESAYRGTSAQLSQQTGYTRPMLSPLLMRPIAFAWAGVVKDAGSAASGLWEENVWAIWRSKLEGRYPFKQSPHDVAIADYTEFFKPKEGILWAFYEANLKSTLKQNGKFFDPTRRFRASTRYDPKFISVCMTRGIEITEATFPAGAAEPVVNFEVNLHSVSEEVAEVSLEIDGAAHVYKNHPEEWLRTQWPAKEPQERGAKVRVRGFSDLDEEIFRKGDFGFYRLLDAASSIVPGRAGGRPNGVPTIVATWKMRSREAYIRLDIRPAKDDNSVSSLLFRDYICPRVITR